MSEFCACMDGPNDPDPSCTMCGGSGRYRLPRNPHVAIVKAAKLGKGLRLSPDEVWELACDSAIVNRAAFILETEGEGLRLLSTQKIDNNHKKV